MREFDYEKNWQKVLTPEIVALLTQIHELRGQHFSYANIKPEALNSLVNVAKIQSTDASNRIEGIYTTNERLKKIVLDKTTPKSRDEKEIAGYRDVLNTIHENYEFIPVKPSIILQLHRDLCKYSGFSIGGKFKTGDNLIEETDAEGNKTTRFEPMSAYETPGAVDRICDLYERVINRGEVDPLIIISMFILDFLCIHPFSDGNGRMSRLLTLLLLYRNNYSIGKYISLEKLINDTRDSYYEALQDSSTRWHDNDNDYVPFVRYMLGIIIAAYKEFDARLKLISDSGTRKPDRVAQLIHDTLGRITKTEIMQQCPDISQTTIQRSLKSLIDSGQIIKIGGGRYTSYTWNWEKE